MKYENIIADQGYASEENYTYLEQQGQKAYIKPADYEIRKKKKFKNDIYRIENMHYEEEKDCYICPNGKALNYAYDSHSKTASGYTVTQKIMCSKAVPAVLTGINALRDSMKTERSDYLR